MQLSTSLHWQGKDSCLSEEGAIAKRAAVVVLHRPRNYGEDGVKNNLPLQDAYLLAIKRENAPVTIYLRNGFQLRGHVRGFDNFTIILEYDNKPHLVYKHAVSTVSPQTAVQFSGADIGAPRGSVPEVHESATRDGVVGSPIAQS
jgi:host factor-I protein